MILVRSNILFGNKNKNILQFGIILSTETIVFESSTQFFGMTDFILFQIIESFFLINYYLSKYNGNWDVNLMNQQRPENKGMQLGETRVECYKNFLIIYQIKCFSGRIVWVFIISLIHMIIVSSFK
jgi:hypothetical protein